MTARPFILWFALAAAGSQCLPAQEIELLKSWPEIDPQSRRRVGTLIKRLAEPGVSEREAAASEKAEAALTEYGDEAGPALLGALSDRRPGRSEALARVLDRALTPRHAALLARFADRRRVAQRRYALRTLARFQDQRMAPVLAAHLEDKDPDSAFFAALGLCGVGRFEGLPTVFERCHREWHLWRPLVEECLQDARSVAGSEAALALMSPEDSLSRVTGLRLLRSLATPESKRDLQTFLAAEQHAVIKAAINTLRVVVDGDEPIPDLTVFDAVTLAEEWRKR